MAGIARRASARSVADVIDLLWTLLDCAGDQVVLVLLCVALFAVLDSALGIGAILPGETALVLAATALADEPAHVVMAIGAAAIGAFAGDHVGFAVGRRFGPRLGETRLMRRLGTDGWERAQDLVARQFWVIVVARLLPGVRTFVAAAAGASTIRYGRFALICSIAATLWATLWVLGGALLGRTVLEIVDRWTIPSLLVFVAVIAAVVVVRRLRSTRTT